RRHTRFSRDWSSDVCSSDLKSARINNQALLYDIYLRLTKVYVSDTVSPSVRVLIFHPVDLLIFSQVITNHFTKNTVTLSVDDLQGGEAHHDGAVEVFFDIVQGGFGTHAANIDFGTETGDA